MTSDTFSVLIVDDEPSAVLLLCKIIGRMTHRLFTAADGEEALSMIQSHDIDIVISDIHMPQVTGIELLTEIKKSHAHIPVIIISGGDDVNAAVECMKIGAADYISKPFSANMITETLQNVLKQNRELRGEHIRRVSVHGQPSFMYEYDIIKTLGEGSMGIIFLVEKSVASAPQRYALKIFKCTTGSESKRHKLKKRFLNEARAAARVQHPHVVRMIEYGLDADETAKYIVMDYVKGVTLQELFARPHRLDYQEKARIISQTASALSAIHAQNICHRDIKPSNIMLDENMDVKLTDFGIAKLPDSAITMQDEILGSPGYMAPESLFSAQVDNRADIFSLGIVAYELCVLRNPFMDDTVQQIARRVIHEDPVDPIQIAPDMPPILAQTILRMLAKLPAERYQSADDVCHDLSPLVTGCLA